MSPCPRTPQQTIHGWVPKLINTLASNYTPIATGAESGRPDIGDNPSLGRAMSSTLRSTYFVMMSAGVSAPKTFWRVICFERILSCTHKSVQSKWRILPRPFRLAMPIAAVASDQMFMETCQPRSRSKDCKPSAWAQPAAMPCSSASPLDNEIVLCVLDQCLTRQRPNCAVPPEVDRRVDAQPAKSVSTWT